MKISNESGISLPLAIWLVHDDYDHRPEPNYISATSLLRSTKQLVLSRRIPSAERTADVKDFLASSLGTAIHDSIEKAWTQNYAINLKKLGYPQPIIDRIVINPPKDMVLAKNAIPIYLEQRHTKDFNGYIVGGKFDMVFEERLRDFKSTSVYSYLLGSKDDDYSFQGSIYRWLNPELITDEEMDIEFIFTDWKKIDAKTNPNYPQQRVKTYPVKLMPLAQTEARIKAKLQDLSRSWKLPEDQLTPCTDKELWRSEPKFKYYADANKTDGRSTKNFDTLLEANHFHLIEKSGKGIVITVPGEVKACGYCPAYDICKQKDAYNV